MPEKLFSLKKVLVGVLLGLVIVGGWSFYPQIQRAFQSTFQRVHQTPEQEIQPIGVKPTEETARQHPAETEAKADTGLIHSGKPAPSLKESANLSADVGKDKVVGTDSGTKPGALAQVSQGTDSGTYGGDLRPYFFRYFENQNLAQAQIKRWNQAYKKRWQEASDLIFILKQEGDLFMIYFLAPEDQRKNVEAKIEAAIGLQPVKRPVY